MLSALGSKLESSAFSAVLTGLSLGRRVTRRGRTGPGGRSVDGSADRPEPPVTVSACLPPRLRVSRRLLGAGSRRPATDACRARPYTPRPPERSCSSAAPPPLPTTVQRRQSRATAATTPRRIDTDGMPVVDTCPHCRRPLGEPLLAVAGAEAVAGAVAVVGSARLCS